MVTGSANAPPQEASLSERIAAIDWWHRIELAPGVVTPGRDRSAAKLARLDLPARLDGMSVLDIGAWDGFFSFECERRGASSVVALDRWDGVAGGQGAGFALAAEVLRSAVRPVRAEITSMTAEQIDDLGRFDLVLFLGVLYHLPDPMAALRNVRRLCADRLILETETDLAWVRRPAVAYYPGQELSGDPSNWYAPNIPALEAMLRECRFDDIRIAWRSGPGHRLTRAARHLVRHGTSPVATLQRGRAVVHARAV